MVSFVTPVALVDDALAEHIAQITENFQGLRNIPISLSGINDASAYALTIKNAGVGAKGLLVYAADGTTVLLQIDAGGTKMSPDGVTMASAPVTSTGAQTLTNKSLTSPTITGTVAGSAIYTAPHFTAPVIDSGGLTVTAGTVGLGVVPSVTTRLLVQGATADNTANGLIVTDSAAVSLLTVRNDGLLSIGKTTSQIGFYGAAGVTKQTAIANATDLATAISLVNSLKSQFQAIGLLT